MKNRLSYNSKNPGSFVCLNGNDVITAKVSDHHPIIHNGVLFWNIMMQGRMRNGKGRVSYNNGFGIVENEKQYVMRLIKIAYVIAEIVYRNPSIEIIGICEGPIEPSHVNILLSSLRYFNCMQRFFKSNLFHKPNVERNPNWGLLMLTDKNYQVSKVKCNVLEKSNIFSKLSNRFQLWKLTRDKKERYFALAHFPFGGDEYVNEAKALSGSANEYCELINHLLNRYSNETFIFCADFNFNPYLIKQWKDRILDQVTHNNSILMAEKKVDTVTVDGILLSVKEKQKRFSFLQPSMRLFERLKNEYYFFKTCVDKISNEKLNNSFSSQEKHSMSFAK
jgi:hypothetical protein